MSFDEIEFQLKYHIMERAILAKEHEVQTLEAKIESVGAIKIQSEDSILQIISEVHKTMKGIAKIVVQLKDPFGQLKINSLYEMFKNICCVMISAVRILAQGCQNGVERNLLKFTEKDSDKKAQIYETLCMQQKIQALKKKEQQNKRLSKKEQYFNDVRTKMEIDRIYQSVQTQKESVRRITASNAVNKLNQVRMDWINMINDSDKILQQAYSRKNQGEKQSFAQKLHKPEYITKVLKEELSNSIKSYFKQSVQKIIKKLYSEFYAFQYNKLKADIIRNKQPTTDEYQQTDIEGMNAMRQMARERKNNEKIAKQLQDLQHQKNQLLEQYIKATRNNELYSNKIQQLEKKLINMVPVRILQKKLSDSRKSIRQSRRNSSRESIHEIEDDKLMERMRSQSKFNNGMNSTMPYTQQNKNQSSQSQLIIRKRAKLKRIYTKSRMHTQNLQSQKKQQQVSCNMSISGQKFKIQNLVQIRNQQPIGNKIVQFNNNDDQNLQRLNQIQEQLNIVHQEQFKSLILKVMQLMKEQNSETVNNVNKQQSSSKLRQIQQIPNQSAQSMKEQTKNTQLKMIMNMQSIQQNNNLQKFVENYEIISIFKNLVRKIAAANSMNIKQALSPSKQKIQESNQSYQNQIAQLKKQDLIQAPTNYKNKNSFTRQSLKTDHINKKSLISQRFSNIRKSQLFSNINENAFNLKQKISEKANIQQSGSKKERTSTILLSSRKNKQKFKQNPGIEGHRDFKMKTITQFDEKQNQNSFTNKGVKLAKFNNQFLQETMMKNKQQNMFSSAFYNHKRIQSDNPNMFLTLPAALLAQNKEERYQGTLSTKRFDKIDLEQEKSIAKQIKRQQEGLVTLKNLTENIPKLKDKISINQKCQINNSKQDEKSQNRLFSIQKVRPSTKQEQKRLPHQQTIIKDIVSICKNYRTSNLNLESLISQYIGTTISQLNPTHSSEKSHRK